MSCNTFGRLAWKDTVDAVNASASKDKNGTIQISLVNVDASKTQIVKIGLDTVNYKNVTDRILLQEKGWDEGYKNTLPLERPLSTSNCRGICSGKYMPIKGIILQNPQVEKLPIKQIRLVRLTLHAWEKGWDEGQIFSFQN